MPRTGKIEKRELEVDPIYGSVLVTRLINYIMISGKKEVARKQVYMALEKIGQELKEEPLKALEKAIRNVAPKLEVRPRRVGGASYQVPVEVRGDRKEALALRWIITSAQAKSNSAFHSFGEKLAAELIDAANNAGGAIKKRDDIQKMANANRAFAHFRW